MVEKFINLTTILLIDDDDTILTILLHLAKQMGAAEIYTAKNGADGLKLACEKIPTLVICDLSMSPVDGVSFLGGLRNSLNEIVSTIPVMMFTGEGTIDSEVKTTKLGISGFYKKPFNPRGMSQKLKAIAEIRFKDISSLYTNVIN